MIDTILAALGRPEQPQATFAALDRALGEVPGHILFTILVYHPEAGESERFYTNLPDAYPVGGRKPITDSPWMQRVLHAGEPYIGRNRTDICDVFFDHALILSLGCESVLNMPARWRGRTVGTLNLLHGPGHYSEADLAPVRIAAQLALPALLSISRAAL
jgi:hypothetical protein